MIRLIYILNYVRYYPYIMCINVTEYPPYLRVTE